MSVRTAKPDDLKTIGYLFEEFRQAHQPNVPYDEEYFLSHINLKNIHNSQR